MAIATRATATPAPAARARPRPEHPVADAGTIGSPAWRRGHVVVADVQGEQIRVPHYRVLLRSRRRSDCFDHRDDA